MTSVYDIVDKIKTYLYNNPSVNHVTFGDIKEVDLDKTTMFPLTHFNISEGIIGSNFISFNLSFLFMDIVDYTKDHDPDNDLRDDASNLLDIFNTQLQAANALISELRRGDLYSEKYQLEGDPVCRMFKDKYENQLAGWRVDLTILIPNNLSVC
jgi:hypothetical protein